MGKKKTWAIVAGMTILKMIIVIFVISEVWKAKAVSPIIQFMMFLVFLRFMTETWYKGLDTVTKWLLEKAEGKKTRKSKKDIGFLATDK